MAKASYRNAGEVIEYTNSGASTIEHGEIVAIGSIGVGVVAAPIKAGETGRVHVVGIWEFPKTTSLSISYGDALYFSTSTNKVTKTNTDVPCGFAIAAAASDAETVMVRLG